MTTIGIGADKGAPGATTVAFVLAAMWGRPCVLLEADGSGADLALRLMTPTGRPQLGATPSVLTLATDARTGPAELRSHAQQSAAGVAVVTGVASYEQATGIRQMWPGVAASVAASSDDVLIDFGRLATDSGAQTMLGVVDRLVVVARPTVEGVYHLRERIAGLRAHPRAGHLAHFDVVLVCDDRSASTRVREVTTVLEHAALPARVLGYLAYDEKTLAALLSGELAGRRAERGVLVRTARGLVEQLRQQQPAEMARAVS